MERRRVPVHCPMVRFSGRHLAYAGTGPAGGRSRCARWEAAAIRVSLGGQPFLYAALVDAVATEDLRAGPMAFGEDSEQDVLRSDMVVAEPSCLLRTQRDGPLGSRGVGESPRQFSDRGPKTSLIAARNRSGVVVSAMAFAAGPLRLAQQGENGELGAHVVVPGGARLVPAGSIGRPCVGSSPIVDPRECGDVPGPGGEALLGGLSGHSH